MHKLTLRLDDLRVESFAVQHDASGRGTVLGQGGGPSEQATCDSCAGPNCKPTRESCASGGDVCCA
ncbi:MAG: hypothetical protein JWM27_3155 [Gemmatimonadetes bacterium]|nr:hypothetical protein [Gemmatimonadota bacterium]